MVVALIVRDCYEAFVVYSFLTLILEHAGGDYNCIEQIKHLPPVRILARAVWTRVSCCWRLCWRRLAIFCLSTGFWHPLVLYAAVYAKRDRMCFLSKALNFLWICWLCWSQQRTKRNYG